MPNPSRTRLMVGPSLRRSRHPASNRRVPTARIKLLLFHPLADLEEAGSLFISGEYYASAMERSWLYGTGTTMGGRGYDVMLPPAQLPANWSSNADQVLPESDWTILRDGASFVATRRSVSELPLKACIGVMHALSAADDITSQLVSYHFGGVTTRDPELHFLLFAQGLKMGRALLDGANKTEQESQLPADIRTRLVRGLAWLFEVSNQRRQTRHAVNKRGKVELKEALTEDEEADFIVGANTLLQYLVSRRIGIPCTLFEDGATLVVA